MRLIKGFTILFLSGALLTTIAGALWLSILRPGAQLRDPLPLYRQTTAEITMDAERKREILDVRLIDPENRQLTFSVSLPKDHFVNEADKKLPILIVISGFRSAHHNLERIPEPGPNVIISYDYPYDSKEWKEANFFSRALIAQNVAYRIPNEVAGLMSWVRRQPWADTSRMSLAGISLGAIALPVIRRRASATGQTDGPSVIAYGGVDIQALAAANLRITPSWLRKIAAWAVWLLLKPLEPEAHLSKISGPFLIINGKNDERLPAESVARLQALLPEPKTILNVEGAHIDGKRPEIIENTVRLARDWLVSQGALNPSR